MYPFQRPFVRLAIRCIVLLLLSGAAKSAEVWLAGVDPFVRREGLHLPPEDYMNLFDDGSGWTTAASHVRVFKTSTQFLANASDADLETMIRGLRARGIKLAVEGLMIPRRQACGLGVEGYSGPGTMALAARRVKQAGGVLDAVAMDEPAWYGHHYRGRDACASPLRDVAEALAVNVKAVREIFPAVKIGDIEPLPAEGAAEWIGEIGEFLSAYQAATGTRLDFLDADVTWSGPWRQALPELARLVRDRGAAFGVIYDGEPNDPSDRAWTERATRRFETVEGELALEPDRAILQTWMPRPEAMLPEDRAGTMTNLVLSYARPAPTLTAQVTPAGIEGRLTTDHQPLPDLAVTVDATSLAPEPVPESIKGVAPATAVRALVGLRLNIECDCSARASGVLGPIAIRGPAGETTAVATPIQDRAFALPDPEPGYTRFAIEPNQHALINSRSVPVVGGSAYELDVRLGVARNSGDAGYLALIFLDAQGKELLRRPLQLAPTERRIAETRTGPDGRFAISLPAGVSDGDALRIAFAGSDQLRAARLATSAAAKRGPD